MKLKLSFSIITDVSDSYQNKILRSMVNGSVKRDKKIYGTSSLLPAINLGFIQAETLTIKRGPIIDNRDLPRIAHFVIMYLAGRYECDNLRAEEKSTEVHYELCFQYVAPQKFKFAYRKSDN